MKSNQTPKYVRRIFQLLVHSLSFKDTLTFHFNSTRSAQQHLLKADSAIKLNSCLHLSTVDLIYPDKRATDTLVTLDIFSNELSVGCLTFDIKKQRMVKDDTKTLFRKVFDDRSGYIDYKFLSAKTDIITQEEYALGQQKRNKLLLRKHEDYLTIKRQNIQFEAIIKDKDRMIEGLEEKVSRLMLQNIEQGKRLNQQLEKLKKPLNIHVNVHSNKERAVSSDGRSRNVQKLLNDLQEAKANVQTLRGRLEHVEVDNKKLSQNCRILIQELKSLDDDKYNAGEKVKQIEKRLSQVDSEYLLTKTLANYDKGLKKSMNTLHQNLKQINELLDQSRQKQKEDKQGIHLSMHKNKSMRQSNFAKLHRQFLIPPKQGQKQRASMVSNQRIDIRQSMSSKSCRDQAIRTSQQLNRKQKEIQILQNELKKKQATIQKLIYKQDDYQRQYQEYQEEKARLFTNMAINSLSQGSQGKTSSEQAAVVRQLNDYNTELLKEKQILLDELRNFKSQNLEKSKKVQSYQLATRKSLLFMSQLSKQKQMIEQRLKEATEGEKAIQTKLLAQKGQQYDILKEQFIQCQQDATQSRVHLKELQKKIILMNYQNATLKQEINKVKSEIQEIRLEKSKLEILVNQAQGYQDQIKLLEGRYNQMQKLQKGIKAFVIRLESQMNLTIKKKDEQIYQAQMKALLKQTYTKINHFQDQFYQALLDATTIGQQAIQRYYDQTAKFEAEAANSMQKQEALWNNRMGLIKQRQAALKAIHDKQQIYKQKKQKKMLLIEDQFQSFLDHFKKINLRINQLQAYRISLKQLLTQGKIITYNPNDKLTSSVGSINERDLPNISSQPQSPSAGSNQLRTSLAKSMAKSRVGDIKGIIMEQPQQQEKYIDNKVRKIEDRKKSIIFKGNESNRSQVSSREEIEAIKQMQNSKILKFQEESQRLKQSFSENLALREELSREKLQFKKKQTRISQTFNEKIRELERQLIIEKSEKEPLTNRLKNAQAKLQQSVKKVETMTVTKMENKQKQVDDLTAQVNRLKEQLSELQNLMQKAGEELLYFSSQEKKNEQEIIQLTEQRQELVKQIKNYEETQNFLIQEVRTMKQAHITNQLEINRLLEERSQQFIKIQKIKSVEIQKLKAIIGEIEEKLEQEAIENMKNKEKIEELNEELIQNGNKMEQRKEEMQLMLQSMQRQLNSERDARQNMQNQNKQYYSHIMELSDNIEAHEREIIRLNIIIQANSKQKRTMEEMASKLTQKEGNIKQEAYRIQQINKQKNEQIRKWQKEYQKLQQEIKFLNKEYEKTKTDLNAIKEQNDKLRDQLFQKQREIINIEKEKGIAMINIQKLQVQIDGLSTQIVIQEIKIKELIQINEHSQLRISDKNHGKSPQKLEKSRRGGELFVSKAITSKDQDSFFGNKQMKISRRMPDLNNISGMSNQKSQTTKSNQFQKSSRGLLVPMMKPNKMLNLPSIDSDPPITQEQNNLQIIEQHHQQLNDTFLDGKANSNTISDQLIEIRIRNEQKQRIDQNNNSIKSSPYRAQQSGVRISAQFEQSQNLRERESPQTFGYKENHFEEYDGVNRNDLIQEVIRLKKEIQEMQINKNNGDMLSISRIKDNHMLGQTYKSQKSFISGKSKEIQASKSIRQDKSFKILKLPSRESNPSENISANVLQEHIQQLQIENAFLNEELEKKNKKTINDELYIAEVQQKLKMVEKESEEQGKDINDLMEELKKISEFNCILQNQVQKMKNDVANMKENNIKQTNQLEERCEQLVNQGLMKENVIFQLQTEIGKLKQASQAYASTLLQQQHQIKQLKTRIQSYQTTLKKQKASYIKYEEQSELQILHLQEQIDAIKLKLTQKQEEIKLLGEKYIVMEETNCSLLMDLKQQEKYCDNSQKINANLANKFESVKGQIQGNQKFRKNTMIRIQELQLQNCKLAEKTATIIKNAGIQSQKWTIRINAQRENLAKLQEKLKDKQKIIIQLKNQIAVYNEQCDELKRLNETLNRELIKAERQLKDIMVQYEKQLQNLSQQANNKASFANQTTKNIKNVQRELQFKIKEIRNCKDQIKSLKEENEDIIYKWQGLKNQNSQMKLSFNNEIQHRKDQYETLMSKFNMTLNSIEQINKNHEKMESALNERIKQLQSKEISQQTTIIQLKKTIQHLSKKNTKQAKSRSDTMISILQEKLKKVSDQLQYERSKNIKDKPQQNEQYHQKQIQSLQNLILSEKQRNGNLCNELKQVVEAFKMLQNQLITLKEKNDKVKRHNSNITTQNRQMERKINQLQQQNEELHKEISSMRFSRLSSFSKIMTDTTIR